MMAKKSITLTSAGLMMLIPTTALAQTATIDQDLERIDFNLLDLQPDLAQAISGLDEAAPAPKHWKLSIGAPVAFNSNVANAETGALSDGHSSPSIGLSYSRALGGGISLEVAGSTSLDAYFDETASDQSSLGGSAKLSIGDASQTLAPYTSYAFTALYADQFGAHKVSAHTITGGVGRTLTLTAGTRLQLDANLSRREASLATVEQWRLTGSTTLTQTIDDTSTFQLQAQAFWADFTGGTAAGRNDEQLIVVGAYTRALVANLVNLTIAAKFQRNWSSFAGKSYSVFDVGPKLTFVSQF